MTVLAVDRRFTRLAGPAATALTAIRQPSGSFRGYKSALRATPLRKA